MDIIEYSESPEQNGSIKRSKTSSPRFRRTNSSTDSSRPCYLCQYYNIWEPKTINFCFAEIDGACKRDNVLKNRERGLRTQTGGGGRMPSAPKPALIFPPRLIKSKKGRSLGFAGTGLSFPSHNTKRGASGSPRTRSSFKPLSTCHSIWINK